MKSLFSLVAVAVASLLTLSITACSSGSKKAATPAVTATQTTKTTTEKTEAKTMSAPTTGANTSGAMTCTNGSDVRRLDITNVDAGCELMYTKHGEAKSVATAKNESSYCDGVSQKIAKNLSAAGFNCK
ncbi:MAG: hypothetical protein AABY53_01745 [Bdellovibrionota bacterium]